MGADNINVNSIAIILAFIARSGTICLDRLPHASNLVFVWFGKGKGCWPAAGRPEAGRPALNSA